MDALPKKEEGVERPGVMGGLGGLLADENGVIGVDAAAGVCSPGAGVDGVCGAFPGVAAPCLAWTTGWYTKPLYKRFSFRNGMGRQ